MTTEVKTKILDEVKRFAAELNLSDSQKAQLHTAYEKAEDRIEDARSDNPFQHHRVLREKSATDWSEPLQESCLMLTCAFLTSSC